MKEINDLPIELLAQVLRALPHATLKMAVLVSKLWRSLGEDPKLWARCVVVVRFKKDIEKFSVGRLRRLQQISFSPEFNWNSLDWEALFRAMMELSSLRTVDGLQYKNFARTDREQVMQLAVRETSEEEDQANQLEAGLFARALAKLEELDLSGSIVTQDQAVAFLTEISRHSQLKKLDLDRVNVNIEPKVLASAVNKLEEVTLWSINDQVQEVFAEMSLKTQLKKLELRETDLSLVDPVLFARALVGLEDVNIGLSVDVTSEQVLALFSEMMIKTELKKIDLSEKDLSLVEPGLFASALVGMECVILSGANVSSEQIHSFFTELNQSSNLKKLVLSYTDLSRLEPELFAKSLNRLEDINIGYGTKITNDQLLAFFLEMKWCFIKKSQLKKLDLTRKNLSAIDPEVLAMALNTLEEVTLCGTKLSKEQMTAILTGVLQDNSRLTKLDLRGNAAANHVQVYIIVRKAKEKLGDQLLIL